MSTMYKPQVAKIVIFIASMSITQILLFYYYSSGRHGAFVQRWTVKSLGEQRCRNCQSKQENTTEEIQTMNRTALVYSTTFLSKCKASRLEHLLQTIPSNIDVWLLHNHIVTRKNHLKKSLDNLNYFEKKYGLRHLNQEPDVIKGHFDGLRSGPSKSSFLKWMMTHREYAYAWHMEDDVVLTGEWHKFFQRFDSDKADFVSTRYPTIPTWIWYHRNCDIDADYFSRPEAANVSVHHKTRKRGNNSTNTIPCYEVLDWKSLWPLIRVSRKGVSYLLKDLLSGALSGHHEAIVQALLLGHRDLTFSEISQKVAHIFPGGWGPYKDSTNLKLTIFEPIEADRVYHPVKCDAYPGVKQMEEFEQLLVSYGWINNGTTIV